MAPRARGKVDSDGEVRIPATENEGLVSSAIFGEQTSLAAFMAASSNTSPKIWSSEADAIAAASWNGDDINFPAAAS